MTDKLSVADDWIEWNGGECPVDRNDRPEVKFRDGGTATGQVAQFWERGGFNWWKHEGASSCNIIAYRLARERGL